MKPGAKGKDGLAGGRAWLWPQRVLLR